MLFDYLFCFANEYFKLVSIMGCFLISLDILRAAWRGHVTIHQHTGVVVHFTEDNNNSNKQDFYLN